MHPLRLASVCSKPYGALSQTHVWHMSGNCITWSRRYRSSGQLCWADAACILELTVTEMMQVRPQAEDEVFRVMKSGKRQKNQWKRMVTKVTFVGNNFTRKPPKYERFIRPSGELSSGDLTSCVMDNVQCMHEASELQSVKKGSCCTARSD